MSRFVLPSVEELDQGVEDRLSENTKRNGEYCIRLIFVGKVKKRDMLAVNNEIIQLLCTFELGQ